MVYDANASDDYVVLFGGEGPDGPLGDTWVFQKGAWSDATPSSPNATNTPSPRYGAVMAYDSKDGYVILFGGATGPYTGSNHPLLNDTWEFLHGTWTPLCTTCTAGKNEPGPRLDSAASDDSSEGGVILFGGLTAEAGSYTTLNDTWMFSSGAWTQLSVAAGPPPRYGGGLAFNSTTGPLVLFGGCAQALPTGEPTCSEPLGDVWTFSAGAWIQAGISSGTPGARANFGFVAFPTQSEIVMFGGVSTSGLLNETWELDNGTWGDMTDSLLWSPSPRDDIALTYDSASGTNYFLLFGGWNGTYLGETWAYPSPFSPLRVSTPVATPNVVDAGQRIWLNVTVKGSTGNYTKTWFGLPVGCSTSNTSKLVCHPETPVTSPTFYSISVRVRDTIGSIVWSRSTTVEVNADPIVGITGLPNLGTIPQNVTFTALVYYGTPPFVFAWNFGDGTNATGNPVTHEYTTVGDFGVNVTANDSLGVSYTALFTEKIARPISVHLGASPASVGLGLPATFVAQATGGFPPYSYLWSGLPSSCSTANAASIPCTANAAGTYIVSVRVTDKIGDNGTASSTLVVSSPSSGIETSILIWISVFVAAGAAILGIGWVTRRSRKQSRLSQRPPTGPPEPPPSP